MEANPYQGFREDAGQKLRGSRPIKETDSKADEDDEDNVLIEVNTDRCRSRRSLDRFFIKLEGF